MLQRHGSWAGNIADFRATSFAVKRTEKAMRNKLSIQQGEEGGEEEDDFDASAKDKQWGKSKRGYYGADTEDYEVCVCLSDGHDQIIKQHLDIISTVHSRIASSSIWISFPQYTVALRMLPATQATAGILLQSLKNQQKACLLAPDCRT